QAVPAKLEKDWTLEGIFRSTNNNLVTVMLEGGAQYSFKTDENTMVFLADDPRFVALPGGVNRITPGTEVQLIGSYKDGQYYYVRAIGVGPQGFKPPSSRIDDRLQRDIIYKETIAGIEYETLPQPPAQTFNNSSIVSANPGRTQRTEPAAAASEPDT